MARPYGLRTEITVNLCILMGAAFLFSGFLLLNLLERELVRTYQESARQQLVLAARLAENLSSAEPEAIRRALAGTPAPWILFDDDLQVIAAEPPDASPQQKREDLAWTRFESEPIIDLAYTSFYLFGQSRAETVKITVPLRAGGRFSGALEGRFSLGPVKEALSGATQSYLLLLVLYGGVLLLFGFWLLGKSVAGPVRRLTDATGRIAGGELEPVAVPEGPREIAELALSFNQMTAALQESRARTDHSISSLQQANEELRQARHELVRSERLASVGHLAAGMAHEIGNPLGAIIGYLELLGSELPPGREREIAQRAGSEAERIHLLVRDLLDFARPDPLETEPVDPAAVLAEAVELLTHQGTLAGIEMVSAIPATLPQVAVSRHKLLQVWINLLVNARDAIRSSRDECGAEGTDTIHLSGGASKSEVWVAIGDCGTGIDPAALPHIFDPFFTTKEPGRGRGLGLSVCHRIISEAGGRIEVGSAGGGGSVFTIWIKRLQPEQE